MTKRGFALAMVLLAIPAAILLIATLVIMCLSEAGYVRHRQQQLQAFYLAQSALNLGHQALAASNFSAATRRADGLTPVNGPERLQATYPGLSYQAGGTYRWQEVDRWLEFAVYFPAANRWVIEAAGGEGRAVSRQRQHGSLEGMLSYAVFDNQDLSEFVRGADQVVTGRVHANGNLYMRPTGRRLTIRSDAVTCAGQIIRHKDAWNRPDDGGTVEISQGSSSGSLVVMGGGREGTAFDAYHRDWVAQAPGRWGGVVKDSSHGVGVRTPPSVQSLTPGGYYDQRAGLRISSTTPNSSFLSTKTFTNQAEGSQVTVKELSLEALAVAGQYPSNGLIYSDVPLRLVKAHQLAAPLTVVCNQNLYVQGDFNQIHPTPADATNKTSRKQPAALISGGRIYHLSSGFKDSSSSSGLIPAASEPSRFNGDPSNVLEINAALVDGTLTVDERNFRREYRGIQNPFYDPVHRSGQNAWQNSDDFLEGLGSVTVRKRGTVVHLQNASMARFDNSGSGVRWVIKTHYGAPMRDYAHDPLLETTPPPFTPVVSRKGLWQCLQ